jgi:hypothetical protein
VLSIVTCGRIADYKIITKTKKGKVAMKDEKTIVIDVSRNYPMKLRLKPTGLEGTQISAEKRRFCYLYL